MKKILSSILIYTVTITNVMAGLPPAATKASGESVYATTFKTNYDTIPVTRNGTEITIGTIPTSKGGTGSTNLGTGILRADSGVMSTANVSLITDVSGILPIVNGGTGSAIASFDGQYITNVQATNITSTHVIGTPDDITSLERVIDHMWSAGVTDGALLTNNGDGTVDIGSSTTMFRPTKATTITRSGATATATSTAHGLHVGDDVYVSGANQSEYNGSFVVLTAPTADTFTYAVQGTPVTPATGTIISGGAHSPIYTANVPAQAGISLTDNATNYLYADYNGGTPQYGVTTSLLNTNCIDKCIAYTIGREGTTLYIIDARGMNVDANRKERRRLLETQGFQHVKGGASIGATGTRNISVTAGAFYYSFNRIINPAFDTSASDTFKYYYQSSPGAWTFTAASTQIDNLQYDTGTGLGTLSNNKFGVHWVYLLLDSPTTLVVQYGQGDYSTLADAQAASVPTAPPAMQAVGVLIGRVIIQKSAASFSEISSAFTTGFTPSTATSHNGLSGLQGGTASEYYHLTSSEYTGTGTGTIVRATSPTLTTPNIGVATGSSLSVTGQLASTVATGTAPLAISSTTKVNNLHVDRATLADTVTTNANLTGDVTSTGNATTYTAVVPTTKGGTGLSTVGTETKVLKVVSGVPAYAEEDRANFLLNPNFEWSTLSDWTCTVGTCTSTSTSGEFSEGLLAMKVALSAQAMNVSQSVATVSGATKQYAVGVSYRVPSTMADFQICTLIAGAEKTCVPSANLILDDAYHAIEIPEVITPGSTVGIKFKTTSAYTANAYFDKAYIKQGIGTQNLKLDYEYGAQVSATGVVSGENTDWINGNCTVSGSEFECTYKLGIFTVTPNCQVIQNNIDAEYGYTNLTNTTSSSILTYRTRSAVGDADRAVSISCQKTGNDYLAASAAVYSQSSANQSLGGISFTQTGSWSTNTTYSSRYGRNGEFLTGNINIALAGAPTSAALTINLPQTIDTAKLSGGTGVDQSLGTCSIKSAGTQYTGVLKYSSTTALAVHYTGSTTAAVTQAAPGTFASGDTINCELGKLPISGWSTSYMNIASNQNHVTTKGVDRPSLVSASVSDAEVVSEDDSVFISSCTNADPSVCTPTTSFFTADPKCWAEPTSAGTIADVTADTTTAITVDRTDAATPFKLFCHGAR